MEKNSIEKDKLEKNNLEKNALPKSSLLDRNKGADKNRLGRGLSALLPPARTVPATLSQDAPPDEEAAAPRLVESETRGVERLPLRAIVPNTLQPRQVFDPESLEDLAESVRVHGILQPIMVRALGGGRYELVAGERRFRAAEKAGLTDVPAVVRTMTDEESLTVALIENIQREDLNAIEAARGYRQLMDQFHLTQTELARQIGKSQPTVANAMGLLRLPEEIQASIASGQVSGEHGRLLLTIKDDAQRSSLWRRVVDQGLSAKELRGLIAQEPTQSSTRVQATEPFTKDIHWQGLEDKLRAALGMKVSIRLGREGRGTLTIEFSDADEIEYLLEKIHVGA